MLVFKLSIINQDKILKHVFFSFKLSNDLD